jgi:outer membrane protein
MKPLAAALLLACGGLASAGTLPQAWLAARQHDPDMAVAQAARQTGEARRQQATALWRPTVGATASAGLMGADNRLGGASFSAPGLGPLDGAAFRSGVEAGAGYRVGIEARLPIYSPERRAQGEQLRLAGEAGELQWQATEQALRLKTAERFHAVALAEARLRLLRQQHHAVTQALAEAQDRFRLGDQPVTDTHEARARAEALRAQVLAGEVELQLTRHVLADSTGWAEGTATEGLDLSRQDKRPLAPLADWLARASEQHPGLKQQALAVAQARQALAQAEPGAGTRVDLVALAGREQLTGHGPGSGALGGSRLSGTQYLAGVQIQLPLYTGGQREALALERAGQLQQAQAELERQQQEVAQQVRAAWLRLVAGQAQGQALQAAREASVARLDATRLGRQVGHRSTLELLQAENDAGAAELALWQWRSTLRLEHLRLLALAGALDDGSLEAD